MVLTSKKKIIKTYHTNKLKFIGLFSLEYSSCPDKVLYKQPIITAIVTVKKRSTRYTPKPNKLWSKNYNKITHNNPYPRDHQRHDRGSIDY